MTESSFAVDHGLCDEAPKCDWAAPSRDAVLEYAEGQIIYYLNQLAPNSPLEHREEMAQECRIRVLLDYSKINANTWPKFIQLSISGTIKDYKKCGAGFEEGRRYRGSCAIKAAESMLSRVSSSNVEGEAHDLDQGSSDVLALPLITPNWELLARMASRDKDLHVFIAHVLLEYSLSALAPYFGVSRNRLAQRLKRFHSVVGNERNHSKPWVKQILYAFGCTSSQGTLADVGIGWDAEPVDFSALQALEASPSERVSCSK